MQGRVGSILTSFLTSFFDVTGFQVPFRPFPPCAGGYPHRKRPTIRCGINFPGALLGCCVRPKTVRNFCTTTTLYKWTGPIYWSMPNPPGVFQPWPWNICPTEIPCRTATFMALPIPPALKSTVARCGTRVGRV